MRAEISPQAQSHRWSSLVSDWIIIAPAIVLRIAGTELAYGAFALLVLHAGRGCSQAIQAIFLSWLFISLNVEIFPVVGDVELIRMLILCAAAFSAARDSLSRQKSSDLTGVTISLIAFIGLCILNSLIASELPSLSFLKVAVFTLMALSAIWIWANSRLLRERMEAWIFNGLMVVAVISAPLPLFGMGYERNDYGFQGILSQPQGFGIVMSLLVTWQLGRMMAKRLYSPRQVLLLAFFASLLVMSASRTGILAFILGTLAASMFALIGRRPDLRAALNSVPPVLRLSAVATMMIFGILFSQGLVIGVQRAILKGDTESSLEENFAGSRGELIEASFDNFLRRPILGNGFGIPSYFDEFTVRYDPIFGLPVSAPVEKGVLPIAVLEELGIVGGIFFLWLIYSLVRRVVRRSEYHMIGLLICALAVNLGEAVLFSAGGFGLIIWLVIGMAISQVVPTDKKTIGQNR